VSQAHRLDVVAVGVAHERAEVVLVVLGPHARLVKHLGAAALGSLEERHHRIAARRLEGDVRLAEPLTGVEVTDPEVRLAGRPVADRHPEVHDARDAERLQDLVVEPGAGLHVGALNPHVIEHGRHPRGSIGPILT